MNPASVVERLPLPATLCGYAPDTPMLLALSGGADSRLLLHVVAEQAKRSGAPLRLAHVNHGIRGEQADADEQFCRALAEQYALPLDVCHADVPTLSRESGQSLETVARRVRYDFFEELMRRYDIPLLLTAHHADDNLETVLFHLARGSGPRGLGGIAPVRPLCEQGLTLGGREALVVRPLLSLTKADILDACRALGLTFVTDSTNDDVTYARNRLRAHLTPVLSTLFDHPQLQALHSCELLRRDEQFLSSLALSWLREHATENALPRAALSELHPSPASRVVLLWITEQSGCAPSSLQIEAVLRMSGVGGTSQRLSLPGGYAVRADKQFLYVAPEQASSDAPRDFCLPCQMGTHDYPDAGFRATLSWEKQPKNMDEINVYNPFIRDTLTFDTIIPCSADQLPSLVWRSRRAGDTLLWHGVHRKLRKLQNELGIVPQLRERLPLLCDDSGILWAPLIGQRDGLCLPDGQHGDVLHVHIQLLPPTFEQ